MKVLVTGAKGRVGANVVARMVSEGYDVSGTDIKVDGEETYHYTSGDLMDPEFCKSLLSGIDKVVHLAAIPSDIPQYTPEQVLNITYRPLQTCSSQVPELIFSSSCSSQALMHWVVSVVTDRQNICP